MVYIQYYFIFVSGVFLLFKMQPLENVRSQMLYIVFPFNSAGFDSWQDCARTGIFLLENSRS